MPFPAKLKITPLNVEGLSSFSIPVELLKVTDEESAAASSSVASSPNRCRSRWAGQGTTDLQRSAGRGVNAGDAVAVKVLLENVLVSLQRGARPCDAPSAFEM